MARQQHHFSFSNRRKASAIIGALVMAGIMAMAVGVMLSSSNTAIRRSGEKIAYEEAYQMALAGTHVARAWIIDPELASSMAGSNAAKSNIDTLIQKATTMNQDIAADVEARLKANPDDKLAGLNLYGTQRFSDAGISFEKSLADGRNVVYTLPVKPMLNLPASTEGDQFSDNLFSDDIDDGNKNYVEWVRITTPGTTAETSASLRECTFIVEAKGVSEVAGKKKERVVQQRLLVKPNEPANPLIGATEAILTDSIVSVKGNSSANVHWGPVLAKGDLNLDFIDPISVSESNGNVNFGISFNKDKANIAGARVYESGNGNKFNGFMDKNLQWKTGVNGKLMAGAKGNSNTPLFKNVSAKFPLVSLTEFDFFAEMGAGTFGGAEGSMAQLTTLDSRFSGTDYATGEQTKTSANNGNGLFEYNADDNSYTGALIQGSAEVDERVDSFFNEMNYETLRAYAEDHAAYYIWENGTLTNVATGETGLNPMNMGNNSDPLSPNAPPDQMLFIDSPAQDPTKPFTQAFKLPGYWKGVIFVNGPMEFPGGGQGESVQMRSPEQFMDYRANRTPTTDVKSSDKVLADGIIICNGVASIDTGGGIIYGTLAAKGGVGVGANFSLFYNPANAEGRLRDTSKEAQPFGLIAGKLYETKVPAI